jgi:hypothetical protein
MVISAERCDAHGGAVAPGTLAVEEPGGQCPPVAAFTDEAQHAPGGRAVPAVEVVMSGEAGRERVPQGQAVQRGGRARQGIC